MAKRSPLGIHTLWHKTTPFHDAGHMLVADRLLGLTDGNICAAFHTGFTPMGHLDLIWHVTHSSCSFSSCFWGKS